MLIKFAVSNFKSFKDETEFVMIADKYKRFPEHIYNTPLGLGLLRTCAIYGNNASGKSNFLEAIKTLHSIITKGSLYFKENMLLPKFKLDKAYLKKPTVFKIDIFQNNIRYSYYLELDYGLIRLERLQKVNRDGSFELIFERKFNGEKYSDISFGQKNLDKKAKMRLEIFSEILPDNQPFFLEGYNRKIEQFKEPFEWFLYKFVYMGPNHVHQPLIHEFATNKNFANYAKQIISYLNLGISNVGIISVPINEFFGESDVIKKYEIIERLKINPKAGINFERNKTLYSAHYNDHEEIIISKLVLQHSSNDNTIPFDFSEESLGTQRLFQIIPSVISAIEDGAVYFIDEIESSIHSILIYDLIKKYLEAKHRKGQLIFTTHECNLLDLDLLRQDEIWFMEKTSSGNSQMYSLSEFKPRFDKDIRKSYLQGQFSYIPFFNNDLNIKW